jgi:lysozyme
LSKKSIAPATAIAQPKLATDEQGDGNIPSQGIEFIKLFEQCRLEPYLDSEGIPTIGWGFTYYLDGRSVKMSDVTLTQQKANKDYLTLLSRDFWSKVRELPIFELINENQRAALLSFCYNTGYFYGKENYDTLNRLMRDRNVSEIPKALMKYFNSDGDQDFDEELGLLRRRYAEVLLWQGRSFSDAYAGAYAINSGAKILAEFLG